ncbi:cytochrome p450 [Trifolium pratense]|uniref:Cytochrome p450 n=1 Tax=Trifolium pratense TaxID=57577 RepID=A0A2K3JLL3_TRIPR|nr:cytochrome p450 [Trifolium pratense]
MIMKKIAVLFSLTAQRSSSSRMQCLSCVIWSIWKQRNNCIWNNVADAQNFVVSRDIAMLNDWRVVHMVSVDAMEQHVGNDCIWKKPTNGRVKCNIDAGV